jgi:hypothetical protein
MSPSVPERYRGILNEKLSDSLSSPLPDGTPRRVFGAVQLQGKVTAGQDGDVVSLLTYIAESFGVHTPSSAYRCSWSLA